MRRIIRVVCLAALASLSLLSCAQTLSSEAKRLGREQVEARLLKCGDSWFARYQDLRGLNRDPFRDFVEIKDVAIGVTADSLSAADRANGLEWQGYVGFGCKTVYRVHYCREDQCYWQGWEDCPMDLWAITGVPAGYSLSRVGGEWAMRYGGFYEPPQPPDFGCTDLPH